MNGQPNFINLVILLFVILGSGCATTPRSESDLQDISDMNLDYQLAIAKTAYDQNRYDEAIQLYKQVIDKDSNNMKANINLSAVYLDLGIRGMAYIGQVIDDVDDARTALALYEEVNDKSREFLQLLTPYATNQ